jgi:ParB-like chromosome segregation protein Spo0J
MAADDLALGISRPLELKVERVSIGLLRPNPRNARTHPRKQLKTLAASIRKFGFNNPVLVDADRMILAGHGRVEAARLVGMTEVPVICLEHLTATQKRAFLIGDNRIAEAAGWDRQTLALELQELVDLSFP